MTHPTDALPLPEPLVLLHTGDDFGGERDDPELEFNSFNAATEFCLSKPAKTKVGLHSDDALRAYGQRCYELAKREALDALKFAYEALLNCSACAEPECKQDQQEFIGAALKKLEVLSSDPSGKESK